MWQCMRPVARLVGDELDVARAADADEHRRLGPLRRERDVAAVGRGDLEVVAVQVDRVVVHRAQVAEADAHAVAGLARPAARVPGNALPLNVSTLKSVISFGFGPGRARLRSPTREQQGEVAVDACPGGRRGWTTNMPIMPMPIWVISSWCGWYMNVPCWRSVNSYLNVSPGGSRAGSARRRRPCRWAAGCRASGRGGHRQAVGDVDAHAVAFDRFDHRAVDPAVVAPALRPQAGSETRGPLPRRRGERP